MPAERWERVKQIFADAAEMPPASRAGYLDAACAGDAQLRAEVESMLSVDRHAPDFLETPLPGLLDDLNAESGLTGRVNSESGDDPDLPPGTQAGNFTIEGFIARGGMGVVYRARQNDPDRAVALKVLGSAYTSRSALRRFAQESRALARLQHPGIAQVIGSGQLQVERAGGPVTVPYFAMELVEGVPITEGVSGLGIPARLELLAQVCDAVEHAHQRGVIHRDLKPANILVVGEEVTESRSDEVTKAGEPKTIQAPPLRHFVTLSLRHFPSAQPKVLDFGVARLIDPESGGGATVTASGARLIGTIPYMSPEQVAGDPEKIDTRTDVYSLGVVACEVLSGQLPYARRPTTIVDAVELIARADPIRPSHLNPALRGDLEAVLLGALEKDPARRYQSAGAFAADLRRAARGEPVSVKPQTAAYLLRSFTRRHKPLVAAAAAGVMALGAGAAVATWEAVRATRAEQKAQQHVQQLQQTANALLKEVYDAVYALPGATEARLKLATQAVALLNELEVSAPDDPETQSALAEGWMKLARTYGAPGNANLRDRAMAIECYDKAIAVMERWHAREPLALVPVNAISTYWEGRANAARTFADRMHDLDMSVAVAEELWPTRESRQAPEQSLISRRLARSLSVRASYDTNTVRRATDARRAVAVLGALGQSRALTPTESRELAIAYRYLADALADASPAETAESADAAREVLAIIDRAAGDAELEEIRRTHGSAASILLGRLSAMNGWNQSDVERARHGNDTIESFLASDPTNDYLQRTLAEALPGYAQMWSTLAAHPAVDADRRRQAATAGAAVAARGLELWALLRDHDQLGPGDEAFEATLRDEGVKCAELLRAPGPDGKGPTPRP